MFAEKISNILGVPVREGKLRQYVSFLDREGRISKKVQLELILAICEKLIEMESTSNKAFTEITKEVNIPIKTPEALSYEDELKRKRLENIKKAQAARKAKYEQRKAQQTAKANL